MSKAHLQFRKPLEYPPENHRTDGGGGFCRHPFNKQGLHESEQVLDGLGLILVGLTDEPGQPVLVHPSLRRHVPRMNEDGAAQILSRLQEKDRTKAGLKQV